MPIKGLTDRLAEKDLNQGKSVRLGTLGKGRREGFGQNVRLTDEEYFVFRPNNNDELLAKLFAEAYGKEPKVISDVRIPVDIAGNFDIEQCAWMTASRHTKSGSTFLARSDGESIKQMRMEETGKVQFFNDGEMLQKNVSKVDQRGADCFVYDGRLYPWQRSFAIDLLLPEFNRLVFQYEVAGYGVVTLTTHSINDIANLIGEYHSIINELASLFLNPREQEQARRWLPLRNFPLRLYRSVDKVSTPNYHKDAKAADRLNSTRSLIHWQLAPEASAAIQSAIDTRTERLISDIAKAPMLTAPDVVDQANADLFGDPQPDTQAALPEKSGYSPPDWEEILHTEAPVVEEDDEDTVDAVFEDSTQAEGDPEELDSQVEDARVWMEEKYKDGSIALTLVFEACMMAGAFQHKGDFGNWLNGPECADLRQKGLKVDFRSKVKVSGAKAIFGRAVKLLEGGK